MKRLVGILSLMILLVGVCVSCGSATEQTQAVGYTTTTASDSTGTTATTGTTEPPILSEAEVKKFALFCAGTTESKVSDFSMKLTYHEERECQVYEISFAVGRVRYEYVFRATDCDIIVNNKTITETTVAN